MCHAAGEKQYNLPRRYPAVKNRKKKSEPEKLFFLKNSESEKLFFLKKVRIRIIICLLPKTKCMYCRSHNDGGPRNSFQRFLVPVYYWKTVKKPETDPQLL
jgi:hypothetical protein